MSWGKKAGFTIIESILVLAITGVLITALLVGVGTSINVQRYRDSVTSFKSQLQAQYSELQNVRNNRDGSWACDETAQPNQGNGATTPGQTDCVLMGRYFAVAQDQITTASVIGYETNKVDGNDLTVIRDGYALGVSPATIETSTMEWGTEIAWPRAGSEAQPSGTTPRSIVVLYLRSPTSGNIYTFTGDTVHDISIVNDEILKDLIVSGDSIPGQSERTLCIASNGLLVAGSEMGVFISKYASSSSSIEIHTNEMIQEAGGDVQC